MFDHIIIGQYIPGNSIIHRLDPRAKLLFVFAFVFVIFLANNWITYGILIGFTLLSVLLTSVPLSYILKGLKPIWWLIIFTILLYLLTTKEGELLWKWGWFSVYEQGLVQAVFISLRLLLLVIAASLLTFTTSPIDVTDGLESLLSPFKKIGLPAHELALMMSIALRFIPTIMEETEKIMKAQMARGAEFTTGSFGKRIKSFVPLLIPLFISAFRRAEELAMAMEARGYRGGEGRTRYRKLTYHKRDIGLIFVFLGIVTSLFFFRT
ncbi:energy-coupling factor transporter transmembrane protein EcfT [Microaerobacter geothermalis]|uniref:energy-coupling factor transporter transmembrane component T family protein n=1 Tax=Microaerobacter geothermalis TaxID=674972 RepID=UPI001F2DC49D|nr:energy-coupling factor transporter transmembrane component T [Microaerobacter geothermalis]MCF6094830.1 energy-coupling factor transporter transmembrane protein EcfT [Microaerobacter geothermalis]